ncbi:hypothetical protein DL93DRAFT_2077216, partial [Clavulina sp. PMI_390]
MPGSSSGNANARSIPSGGLPPDPRFVARGMPMAAQGTFRPDPNLIRDLMLWGPVIPGATNGLERNGRSDYVHGYLGDIQVAWYRPSAAYYHLVPVPRRDDADDEISNMHRAGLSVYPRIWQPRVEEGPVQHVWDTLMFYYYALELIPQPNLRETPFRTDDGRVHTVWPPNGSDASSIHPQQQPQSSPAPPPPSAQSDSDELPVLEPVRSETPSSQVWRPRVPISHSTIPENRLVYPVSFRCFWLIFFSLSRSRHPPLSSHPHYRRSSPFFSL